MRGFSFSNDQSLTVVLAAFAGSGIGAFQFTVQEFVRGDASGGNTFRVGVQQGRVSDLVRRSNEIFQQSPEFRRLDVAFANVATAGDLDGGGKIGQHHIERTLVLREIVGQRTRHRILQQHLVGLQAVPVDSLNLRRVEIHGDDADHQKHTENYIENRDACVSWGAGGQVSPFTFRGRRRRSGGGFQRYP